MSSLNVCQSKSTDIVDMCEMDVIIIGVILIAIILLLIGLTHLILSNRQRFRTLFYLHNARSMLYIVLVVLHIFEIAESYLAADIEIAESISISPLQIIYAWISCLFVAILITFVRFAEIHDKAVYLCLSVLSQAAVFIVKMYKIFLLLDILDLDDVRPFLISCIIGCSILLAFIDLYTVYFELVATNRTVKSAMETHEKISYKHSRATFVSKLTFYWLTPFLWQGYKDPLEFDDLGHVYENETGRAQYDRFHYVYRNCGSKTPSLWLCYAKTYWKMFTFGGLLKLVGDLTTLVGPISITLIFDYIQRNLSAAQSTMMTTITPPPPGATAAAALADNGNNSFSHIEANELSGDGGGGGSGYGASTTMPLQHQSSPSSSALSLINENTEIYYPTWTDFVSNGWIMALVVLCASMAQGTLSQSSTHIVNMIGIRLRCSLQSLVYRKTLLISSSCFFNTSAAAENANVPATGIDTDDTGHTNDDGDGGGDGMRVHYTNDDNNCTRNCDDGNGIDKITSTNNVSIVEGRKGSTTVETTMAKDTATTATSTAFIDTGTIANLMSEDALNVMSFFWIAHYVWAIPLKIGFVMYLLYRMLGTSAIIGSMVCIIIMLPLQFVIGKKMSSNAEMCATNTDDRLRRVTEFLNGMKVIKLNAWENVFKEKIQMSRDKELLHLDKDSIYWTLMTFLIHISSIIIAFVTIAVFLCIEPSDDETSKFTTSRVFAALALFNQLTVPLFIFPITIPIIISAIVSTRRLEQFLRQPEVHKEFEGIRKIARVMSRSEASLDAFEIDDDGDNGNGGAGGDGDGDGDGGGGRCSGVGDGPIMCDYQHSPDHLSDVAFNIGFESTTNVEYFTQESVLTENDNRNEFGKRRTTPTNSSVKLKKNNQISIRSKLDRNRPRQKSLSSNSKEIQPELSNDLVVSVRDAVFTWDTPSTGGGNSCLRIDRLDIPRGKLTVIVGRNGSGKTSLLAAILREMRLISGELVWHKYSTISYVQQTPWLLKATIRDNIIFGEPFRPRRYDKVLFSCCLKQDIDLMPDGDMTEIGTNGLNLSGGQRQRITIARALYSSANVVIMDDPLSSLDNEVSKCIFDNGIRNMLSKHQRTIIMVTQKTNLVHSSDYIISMESNGIRAKGTYRDIENDDDKLIQEWNSIIAKENAQDESISIGKTARERWKLFKNISRIGLQHVVGETDTQTVYGGCKRKPSLYGSRHLTYEAPFPIDECYIDDIEIRRRPSRRERRPTFVRSLNRTLLRSHSLNVRAIKKTERMPVVRNASTPSTFQYANQSKSDNRLTLVDGDGSLRHWDFRQFIDRMSFKRRKYSRKRKSLIGNHPIKRMTTGDVVTEAGMQQQSISSGRHRHDEEADDDDEICADHMDDGISNRLIYDEERKYGQIPNEIYMLYLKSCGLRVIIVFGLSAVAWQAMKIYMDVWLRNWTDVEAVHRFTEVSYHFGIYTLLSIICIMFAMVSTPAGQFAGSEARRHLHERLLNAIAQKSMYFFQITPFARIMNRFSADMAVIDKKITATIQRLTQFILLCLCAICVNAIVTPWFILLTIPIAIVYLLVQKFYRYSSRELQRIESISSAPILSHFVETIQGVMTIRAFNQESRFMEILFKRIEANNIVLIMLESSNRWLGIALDYLGAFILFAAIVTALFASKIYSNATSPSLVALAINYTLLVPIYLNWVVKLSSDLESYIGAVERISQYISDDDDDDRNGDGHAAAAAAITTTTKELQQKKKYDSVPISWPKTGDITFDNVSLRYDGQTENIISNLNLIIPAGQRLGICGRTSCGKSTLALALFRAVEITNGRIIIDDVDISGIHTDEIRTRLSIIPQDIMLFGGTIRENLDPRGHYADLDLWNSLESARLKQTIVAMPHGLDTTIVDNGNNIFSCGEKQLFCLARAVLRGSVCLVLDEATAFVDGATEIALLETAAKAFQGRTIITIAHRLTTLLNYDRIIVLDNGAIVEDGTPQELRTKSGGKFSTMLYSSIQGTDFPPSD